MITANNALITSKADTWELLINYFKQHYGNKCTAAGNLKQQSSPIITQWVKTAWDYINLAIITKLFKKCSISNDLDGMEDDVLWAKQYEKSDTDSEEDGDDMYDEMVTHKQIQQMFSEESDDVEFFGFESMLLILVCLICRFDSREVYWS